MSEKYIDLAEQVIGGSDRSNTVSFRMGVAYAFEWLDENPDQVPGRTITESEFQRKIDDFMGAGALRRIIASVGVTIIPDPEPTNAEKLKAVLDAIGDSTAGYREHLASKLDDAGVKAPGGDDG